MFRFVYKTELGTRAIFHTIAENFAEAIQNFKETTGLNELNVQIIQYLD